MYIYCITNLINHKKYVGITVRNPPHLRFEQHIKDSKNPRYPIHHAILKYGKENFSFEILETTSTKEELKEKEKLWIQKFNTVVEGYNISLGGDGCNGYKHTEEHKNYMKRIMRGKRTGRPKGFTHTKETKQKLSNNHIQAHLDGKYKTRKGQTNTPTHRANISKSKIGKSNEKLEKKYLITHPDGKTEVINGLLKWCKLNNLHAGNLCSVAKGKLNHYKGYKASLI